MTCTICCVGRPPGDSKSAAAGRNRVANASPASKSAPADIDKASRRNIFGCIDVLMTDLPVLRI